MHKILIPLDVTSGVAYLQVTCKTKQFSTLNELLHSGMWNVHLAILVVVSGERLLQFVQGSFQAESMQAGELSSF